MIYILFVFLIFQCFNSQNIKITYELKYKANKNSDSISTELLNLLILEDEKKILLLQLLQSHSRFYFYKNKKER